MVTIFEEDGKCLDKFREEYKFPNTLNVMFMNLWMTLDMIVEHFEAFEEQEEEGKLNAEDYVQKMVDDFIENGMFY
jgi:hypothetical protein